MRIDKITVIEFGALKNRSFSLTDGINIFEGQNESGKSTLVSFIRFMLYGMPKKTNSQELSDRERWLSWDNLASEGYMEITVPNGSFRIERRYRAMGDTARDAIDECKIIDLATGEEVHKNEVPGKIFLGITSDVYDSTSCVRQLECSSIDGASVRSSIENLLLSADEKIDTKKSQENLDKIRKSLLHKNAKGGQIYELEQKKAELFAELTKAKEDAEVIISKQNAIAHLIELENGHEQNAKSFAEKIRIYETCLVLKRFIELHAEEDKVQGLKNSIEELTETRGFFGKLPDRSLLEIIADKGRSVTSASDKLEVSNGELANAEASPCGDRNLASIHEKIEADGGKNAVVGKARLLLKKQRGASAASVFLYIFGFIFLLGGALGLLAPIIPIDLAQLFNLIPLPETLRIYAFAGAAAIGTILADIAIIKTAAASKNAKKRFGLFAEYQLDTKKAEIYELENHADLCRQNYDLCVKHDEACAAASAKREAASNTLNEELDKAVSLLASVNTECDTRATESVLELLAKRRGELVAVCEIKEKLEFELKSRQMAVDAAKTSLEEYDENALKESIPADTDVIVTATTTDPVDLKRRYDFSNGQHNSTMQKRIEYEKELACLLATAKDPVTLDTAYNALCHELVECRKNYDATVMAIEAIDTASDTIRRNVTPTIRGQASGIIEKLTAGKYGELGLDADLDITVSVNGATRSIDAFSKGTRDAAYISLRMALVDLICTKDLPPLIFDEGFSLLDDVRAQNMLTMLYAYTQHNGQCLLFTCPKREAELIGKIGKFNHITL